MTPTEELRAKLDELDVEWWPSDDPCCEDVITHWCVGPFQWTAIEGEKDLWLNAGIAGHEPLTPEQAIAATVGGKDASAPRAKVKAQSDYIGKLRGEYKALDEQMERTCAEYRDTIRRLKTELDAATVGKDIERYDGSGRRGTVAILQGGRKPEEVLFVQEDGVTNYLPEDAGTCRDLGGVGADDEVVFHCSECGCVMSVFDKDGKNNLCTSFIYDYPRFCPECGRRIEVSE